MRRIKILCAVACISAAAIAVLFLASTLAVATPAQRFCISGLSQNIAFQWEIKTQLGAPITEGTIAGFQSLVHEYLDTDAFARRFVASIDLHQDLHAGQTSPPFDPCFFVSWSGGPFHLFVRSSSGSWCNVSTEGPCTFNPTIKAASVGGVGGFGEQPEMAEAPLRAPSSSGNNVGLVAAVAGAIAAGAVALGGAAWYARRRWAR